MITASAPGDVWGVDVFERSRAERHSPLLACEPEESVLIRSAGLGVDAITEQRDGMRGPRSVVRMVGRSKCVIGGDLDAGITLAGRLGAMKPLPDEYLKEYIVSLTTTSFGDCGSMGAAACVSTVG